MIKKTICVFIVLFGVYAVVLPCCSSRWWFNSSQHQWDGNMVRAQDFIYSDDYLPDNVIVGSSLSRRIVMDRLPNTYNLSFDGLSIFDGLKILAHASKFPKHLFIEMNVVLRPESSEFTSSVSSPIMYYPRKVLLPLRAGKQPIAILGHILAGRFEKLLTDLHSCCETGRKCPEPRSDVVDDPRFSMSLNLQIESYSKMPTQGCLDNSFQSLKSRVDVMVSNGVDVIFYEMPVNSQLEELPLAKGIRDRFYKVFPADEYRYILLPAKLDYVTSDGVYLNKEEALKYTAYFKREAGNCFGSN